MTEIESTRRDDVSYDDLNDDQKRALDDAHRWWHRERYKRDFHVQGLAGTGKTTMVRLIMKHLRATSIQVAPTGKAARVLEHKSGRKTTTVHKLLYRPIDQKIDELRTQLRCLMTGVFDDWEGPIPPPEKWEAEAEVLRDQIKGMKKSGDGDAKFSVKDVDTGDADMLVVEEYSQVGKRMGEDLKTVKLPKMFIGDPFQLPPVKDTWAYQGIDPDVFLKKIERTGAGSGVARVCMDVREGRKMRNYGEDFQIVKKGQLQLNEYLTYGMILVGTNDLRKRINHMVRSVLGYRQPLVLGEKLAALNNQECGISNGEVLTVRGIEDTDPHVYILDLEDNYGNVFPLVEAWKETLFNDEQSVHAPRGVGHFCRGNCLTVHKAQGSEEDRVLLLNSWRMDDPIYRRWLYTGASRARQHLTFIP